MACRHSWPLGMLPGSSLRAVRPALEWQDSHSLYRTCQHLTMFQLSSCPTPISDSFDQCFSRHIQGTIDSNCFLKRKKRTWLALISWRPDKYHWSLCSPLHSSYLAKELGLWFAAGVFLEQWLWNVWIGDKQLGGLTQTGNAERCLLGIEDVWHRVSTPQHPSVAGTCMAQLSPASMIYGPMYRMRLPENRALQRQVWGQRQLHLKMIHDNTNPGLLTFSSFLCNYTWRQGSYSRGGSC